MIDTAAIRKAWDERRVEVSVLKLCDEIDRLRAALDAAEAREERRRRSVEDWAQLKKDREEAQEQ